MTEHNDFESELAELAALEVAMYDPLAAAAELSETVKEEEEEEEEAPEVAELDATPDAPPASEPPPPVSGIAMGISYASDNQRTRTHRSRPRVFRSARGQRRSSHGPPR